MLVKNWMTKSVVTIDENQSIDEALALLDEYEIRILPVMRGDVLVGMISDRQLKKALSETREIELTGGPGGKRPDVVVGSIMSRHPITIPPDFTVEETAEVLLTHQIQGVPVVADDGKLVGVVTPSDIFEVLILLTGVAKRGIQFGLSLVDRPGCIREVTDLIRSFGGRVSSILSTDGRAREGYRQVYIRIYGIDRPSLDQLIRLLKESNDLLYMIDHQGNRREIFSPESDLT